MPIIFDHPINGEKVTINLQPAAIVISPRFGESYSFDLAGRLLSLFVNERSLQRTLDHRLLVRQKSSAVRRIELSDSERDATFAAAFATLRSLRDALPAAGLRPEDRAVVSAALGKILIFRPETLRADGEAYKKLFLPVSILPPDQYMALVIQATEGCSWNKCTFCGLYRDRKFRVRGVEEFRKHCESVRDFFGDGLSLRRGIFLADANALTVPQARLIELVQVAQSVFGENGLPRPLFSFVSAFDAQRKTSDNWAVLKQHGLERIYIGLETGDDDLLRFIEKPGDAQDAVDAVADIKAGGVSVGVIAMVGLGGDRYSAQHVENTIKTISAMPLDKGDVIYLSAYRPAPKTEYPAHAHAANLRMLSAAEEKTQQQVLQEALRARFPESRVAPYRVEGFAL